MSSNTMKILHVFDHSIPLHSGYTFRSMNILLQQRALGWQTVHVTGPKQGVSEQFVEHVDDLSFYRSLVAPQSASTLPIWNQVEVILKLKQALNEVIAREQPDIIHAHSPTLNGLAALMAGKKHKIPVVYEIRAFWEDAAVSHGTCQENDLRYRITRAIESYTMRHADAVTCICEGLRQDIVERGIPAGKITAIPNAVDATKFSVITSKDNELLEQLNLHDKFVLGFLGSFYDYEGLEQLIEATARLVAQQANIHLLLVGGGPKEAELKAQVRRLGLDDHITFTGRVPHGDVGKYYSLVDLLVFPRKSARITELVTPLKPLEAMAQGKLVLASDVGGHKELIQDGKTGYLFKADDITDMVRIILDIQAKVDHQDVLDQALQFVHNERTWQRSISHYRQVYGSLTGHTL